MLAEDVRSAILGEAGHIAREIRDVRRRIHANPEPGYEETATAAIAAAGLTECGIPVKTGIAKTGVLGLLDTGRPGPVVALRADMDALRKDECADAAIRPHRSSRKGLMHACGHDGHVAILIGAARILKRLEPRLRGAVKFLFQPAEEGGKGALAMIEAGVLEDPKVDAAFALHAWPEIATGRIGFHEGVSLAASSDFTVEVTGESGHAAFPEQCVDPVPAAAQIITALQAIRSREIPQFQGSVISVTIVETGSKTDPKAGPGEDLLGESQSNIIPQVVRLTGTSRSLSLAGQAMQLGRLAEIAGHVAAAHRCKSAMRVFKEYPPTVNDPETTRFAFAAASGLLGPESVVSWPEPVMGGEDFSYVLQRVPGTFAYLGTGAGPDPAPLHSDRFDFDDDALIPGMAFMAGVAAAYLAIGT